HFRANSSRSFPENAGPYSLFTSIRLTNSPARRTDSKGTASPSLGVIGFFDSATCCRTSTYGSKSSLLIRAGYDVRWRRTISAICGKIPHLKRDSTCGVARRPRDSTVILGISYKAEIVTVQYGAGSAAIPTLSGPFLDRRRSRRSAAK